MTLPILTAKYRITVTETALKRFYTTMNEAVKLSVVKNGESKYWVFTEVDDNPDEIEAFFNMYLKDYIKVLETKKIRTAFYVYFADGSAVRISYGGKDWTYCVNAKDVDKDDLDPYLGTRCFLFGFYPMGVCSEGSYGYKNFHNRAVEPYVACLITDEDGNISNTTINDLYKKRTLYTKIIQLNGWKIPKDYPLKF